MKWWHYFCKRRNNIKYILDLLQYSNFGVNRYDASLTKDFEL